MKLRIAVVVAILACSAHGVLADVRADEKTRIEFGGMLGRMVNFFGGKAAREGVTSTVAVKGDRKARLNDTTGQIIDLAEEKVYDLDMKKKTFKVTTFAELRRRMEEAQKKAQEDARKQEGKEKPEPARTENEKQVEFDVDVKNTGQTKTINGLPTSEQVITVTIREKGKTLEQGGGMVVTTDMWITPKVAAMNEVRDFDMRYAAKLYGPIVAGASAEQMAAAMALYPMMKQAMGRMSTEGAKIDGTPILTTMTMEGVKSEEQIAQETKQKEQQREADSKPTTSGGLGGLLGGLAKKAAEKKVADKIAGDDPPRATVMTSTIEVLKIATDVSAADVAVPAGFKENK
jgi:hypothetical protein